MTTPTKMVTSTFFRILTCALLFFNLTTYIYANPTGDEESQTTSQDSQAASEESSVTPDKSLGVIDYRIRDSETGYAIQATLKYADVEEGWGHPRSATTDEHGRVRLVLPPAHYLIEVSAPGYKRARIADKLNAGTCSRMQFMMVPETPPEELRPEVMESKLFKGYGLWQGYVVDAVTFKPLAGARVRLEKAQLETRTNERGYFSISAPVVDPKDPLLEPPVTDTMTIELAGYKTYIVRNCQVPGEGAAIDFSNIDLEQGQGGKIRDATPKSLRDPSELKHQQSGEPSEPTPLDPRIIKWLSEKPAKGMALGTGESLEVVTALAISLPSQIIVGLNCGAGRRTCTTASPPYSLEEYVQRGLDEEWPRTWHESSLKAGAVAYRSYGAYYVANKVCPYVGYNGCTAVYDICSNIYCQVFGEDRPTKTKNAAIATAGVVLTRDGTSIIEAEYSGENNSVDGPDCRNDDRSCADGYAGSPNSAFGHWPCVVDRLCAGAVCRGHGRGMCQDGSQRWATGKNKDGVVVTTPRNWQCILDHYYNDNGNYTGSGTGQRTAWIEGPKGNGRLVHDTCDFGHLCGDEIWTRNPDPNVAEATQLTRDRVVDEMPAWGPDGASIVWVRHCPEPAFGGCIYKMNSDGTGMTQLTFPSGAPPSAADLFPSWSPSGNGRIAFTRPNAYPYGKDIWAMNSDGSGQTRVTNLAYADDSDTGWSPDGARIVFTGRAQPLEPTQIFVVNDAPGSSPTQLTFGPDACCCPSWSPDGTRIAFARSGQIWIMNSDGSGPNQIPPGGSPGSNRSPRWSPDGVKIAFAKAIPGGGVDIYTMSNGGGSETRLTFAGPLSGEYHMYPRWSPDGKKIAFLRWNQDGTIPQIYVMGSGGSNPDPTRIGDVRNPGVSAFDCMRCGRFDAP